MLATTQLIREPTPFSRLDELLPSWRKIPLYQYALGKPDFSRLPFITKHDLRRDFPHNFLGGGQNLESLLQEKIIELEHTSGTSDERTPVIFGRGWWNEQEARVLRLNSFVGDVLDKHPQARRATLTPPVCNGLVCFSNWHSKSARTLDTTLFVNLARIPFVLSEKEFARMAWEISEWSPQFLDLDPVHGAWFALYCERNGLRFPSVKFILCSYEFVSVVHRRIIGRVLGVPVFNLYGSTETGHLLMENGHCDMKPSEENVFYEIIAPDERGVGDLVVTTLTNQFMPLLRYRIGDLAERVEKPDGTTYRVHGRSGDALLRHDGRRVTTLDVDECFVGVGGVVHYHLRQQADGDCRLQYLPDGTGPSVDDLNQVTSRLQTLLQLPQPVAAEAVDRLPPTPSGKFRLTQRETS